jgi:hypothetical protein
MKILTSIVLVAIMCSSLYASPNGLITSDKGSTYSKSCSTPTVAATELFTLETEKQAIESVTYYNTSAYDVYLATYAAVAITNLFPVKAGVIPLTVNSTAFRYGLSSGTVSGTVQILICK